MPTSHTSLSDAMGLKALLDVKGLIILRFNGSSMIPTIPPKSELYVEKLSTITPGNIYVFHLIYKDQHPRLVCHRLHCVENKKYYFQGDNRSSQEVVDQHAIIGVVRRWIQTPR